MSTKGRVTLAAVARAAGVSQMTVSMALRNHPRISAATRLRVQRLAEALGYRPDPLLSRLMAHLRTSGRRSQPAPVAYLVSRGSGTEWRQTYLGRLFDGAERRATELGFTLDLICMGRAGVSTQRVNTILRSRGIEGVLIAPLSRGGGHLNLDFSGLSAAHVGASLWRPALPCAHHDYTHGTMLAMRHLVQHGYRRIGLVTNQSLTRTTEHQEEAAFLYYAARLRSRPLPPLVVAEWTPSTVLQWYRRHRPDAVFTCYPELIEVLREAGYPVPEAVGVALNWIPDGAPCSGIWQDFEAVGAAAFDLVESQLRRHEYGLPAKPKTVLVKGRWVEGATLRAVSPGGRRAVPHECVFVESDGSRSPAR